MTQDLGRMLVRLEAKVDRFRSELKVATGDSSRAAARMRGDAMSTSAAWDRAGGRIKAALAGAFTVAAVQRFTSALLEAEKARQKIERGMTTVAGSSAAAQRELDFVAQVADRMGLNLGTAAEQYTKLSAASKGTALEGVETRRLFETVAAAASKLGLSTEETGGALTALQQIISKGKVSAEELRGQLGERLPGAFQIAARAVGVTTAELDEMLKKGALVSDEFLPKFRAELERSIGGVPARIDGLSQATERLSTAWFKAKTEITASGFGEGMTRAIEDFGTALKDPEVLEALRDLGHLMGDAAKLAGILARNAGLAAEAVSRLVRISPLGTILPPEAGFRGRGATGTWGEDSPAAPSPVSVVGGGAGGSRGATRPQALSPASVAGSRAIADLQKELRDAADAIAEFERATRSEILRNKQELATSIQEKTSLILAEIEREQAAKLELLDSYKRMGVEASEIERNRALVAEETAQKIALARKQEAEELKQSEQATLKWGKAIEPIFQTLGNAIEDFVLGAEIDMETLRRAMLRTFFDITAAAIKAQAASALKLPEGSGTGAIVLGGLKSIFGFAEGGLATRPMIAAFAENEPEFAVPWSKVGQFVQAAGGGGDVEIQITNTGPPIQARAEQQQGPDGRTIVRMMVEAQVKRGIASGAFREEIPGQKHRGVLR